MQVKQVERNRIVKYLEINPACVSNQDHFEDAMRQVMQDFSTIIDEDEMREFTENVFKKVFKWKKD